MRNFFVLLFFLPLYGLSQLSFTFEKNFKWFYDDIFINGKNQKILTFEGADLKNNLFPGFGEVIPIKNYNGGKVNFEITDIKTSDYKLNNRQKINELTKNIELTADVFYSRGNAFLVIKFHPVFRDGEKVKKVDYINIKVYESGERKNSGIKYATASVLASGKWVKIGILKDGVYKITYEQLRNLGFDNPQNVRVFGDDCGMLSFWNKDPSPDDLTENKIFHGSDYLLFFAKGPNVWYYDSTDDVFLRRTHLYSDTAYYFLTDKNTGFDNSIEAESVSATENQTATTYDYYATHESDNVNILHSGRIWLGEEFSFTTQRTFEFDVPNTVTSAQAKVIVALAGRSAAPCSFQVSTPSGSHSISIAAVSGENYLLYADYEKNIYSYTPNSSTHSFTITYNKPNSSAQGWLDYLTINCKRQLYYNSQQFLFRNKDVAGSGNITKFLISNAPSDLIVWDVSNPAEPKKMSATNSGGVLSFKAQTDDIKEFVVFRVSDAYTPVFEGGRTGEIANQNLHGISAQTDMLILTNPLFLSGSEKLAELHRQRGLNVEVINVENIYNEFSSGMPDVPAIRNFIRFVYRKSAGRLRYVLLVGDGCYHNKGNPAEYANYFLTYQTQNSFNEGGQLSLVSDDFFALLDDNEGELTGMMDVGIGRLPIKSNRELEDFVQKEVNYLSSQSFGDWKNIVTILADDEENNIFMSDAEDLANKIDTLFPYMRIKKIYLDAYKQEISAYGQSYPDVTVAINNRVKDGTLVMAFLGHGNMFLLTHEHVLLKQDIEKWDNFDKLLFFITGTCEFGKFDNYYAGKPEYKTSAAEAAVLNPNGGAIGMLTTVRPSYVSVNKIITMRFFDFIFDLPLGEAFLRTKNSLTTYNKHTFALLSDPALKLQVPELDAEITDIKINSSSGDTIHALDKISVSGQILQNNVLAQDFNGIVYPVLADKKQLLKTLNNDGVGAFQYWTMNNVLFRGQASVKNGKFSFEFYVPKDINYNFGLGRFFFYAKSDSKEAKGYKKIAVGGINENAEADNQGPVIRLFMNDTTFVSGGITDENPTLLGLLYDEHGINTSTSGFGHDITAILDNDATKVYLLNEFYQADLNTYRSGKVKFNFYKLSPGEHTVNLKAWDVYNNMSEAELDFVVENAEDLKITHLLNYPNPFTTHTTFYFEHNKPGVPLEVLLQIFTVSGKLVKTFHLQMTTDGYRSDPIEWDGLDDFGNRIGKGVYIYKVKVITPNGKQAEVYEKLLILR